eukprot:XP_001700785.1 predicted protein [Chlamydomonas reinhardtii]
MERSSCLTRVQAEDPLSLEAAAATLDVIWGLARRRQVDELLRYFPDSVVDGADELRSAAESDRPLTFRDVVEYGFEIKGFTFDSYAERHLYFAPPAAVTRLSGFRTAPDRCVLRRCCRRTTAQRASTTYGRNPMYRPLLRHRTAAPYRRKMLSANSYSEVAKVGCWMVDGVSLVAAKVLS